MIETMIEMEMETATCHGTLVLHADGTVECDEVEVCGAVEVVHDWWVSCVELGCGCTGDEGDLVVLRPSASAAAAFAGDSRSLLVAA